MKYLAVFVLLCSSICNAGTIDPNIPDSRYIKYGSEYACVLKIRGIYADKLNSGFAASCVIIDRYHVLTAAHIVENSITQHVLFENKAYPCAVIAIHIKYDSKIYGKHDIAIARLQTPIDLDFYPELYDKKDEQGKVCGIAGWGISGNFNTGIKKESYDNIRRAGSNVIAEIEHNMLITKVDDRPKTELEFLIGSGDSGGGLFIDKKVAGINSCVLSIDGKADSSRRDMGGHTRVSDYIGWIKEAKKSIAKIIENEK
jgi:hypothetical protein